VSPFLDSVNLTLDLFLSGRAFKLLLCVPKTRFSWKQREFSRVAVAPFIGPEGGPLDRAGRAIGRRVAAHRVAPFVGPWSGPIHGANQNDRKGCPTCR
jgi:hypothetical protein